MVFLTPPPKPTVLEKITFNSAQTAQSTVIPMPCVVRDILPPLVPKSDPANKPDKLEEPKHINQAIQSKQAEQPTEQQSPTNSNSPESEQGDPIAAFTAKLVASALQSAQQTAPAVAQASAEPLLPATISPRPVLPVIPATKTAPISKNSHLNPPTNQHNVVNKGLLRLNNSELCENGLHVGHLAIIADYQHRAKKYEGRIDIWDADLIWKWVREGIPDEFNMIGREREGFQDIMENNILLADMFAKMDRMEKQRIWSREAMRERRGKGNEELKALKEAWREAVAERNRIVGEWNEYIAAIKEQMKGLK